MSNYRLMTDSNSEIPYYFADEHDVPVFRMPYIIDGEENLFDLGRETNFSEFYTRVKEGAIVATATRSPQDIQEFFESILKDGKDILYLCFSSALSGHYDLACMAKKAALENYPSSRIEIIDTKCISMNLGILVMSAQKRYEAGLSMDELIKWVEDNKLRSLAAFSIDDLMYLKRTGRLSSISASFGTMLDLKPMLKVDREGKIVVCDKVKGKKKVFKYILNIIEENYDPDDELITDYACIVHANNLEAAENLKSMIEEKYKFNNLMLQDVGPVIGSHTGPGVVALLMFGDEKNR